MTVIDLELPDGFWTEDDGDVFVLGVDESIKDITGAFIEIGVPEEGEVVDSGNSLAIIQGTETDVKVQLPFTSVVVEVNRDLLDLLNFSDKEWLVKFEKYRHEE